jgi:LCP family protein required for cell wall assembly
MTILLTGSEYAPAHIGGSGALGSSTAPEGQSGLIALVHIDADRRAGAIVSIPPNALVRIPGHGVTQLSNALPLGGPSLLIRTVEHLTNVRIDHYSVVDFNGLAKSLRPLRGVNVDVPEATSSNGVHFHPGINHLTTVTAIDYVRQTSLSEEGRVLRQQALLRAILDKLAHEHLLNHPTAGFSILDAFTRALSVDSNFTNSALESLALHLHLLGGGAGTFVSAPVARTISFHGQSAVVLNFRISRKMWRAIRHDAVAAFARRYPFTVTPHAPR